MRGWRSRKRAVTRGERGSEVGIAPIRSVPSSPPRSRLASCVSDSMSASARCAQPRISSPSGVSSSNSRPRRTSGTPSSRSSDRIPADSVGCETWHAAAARPKWRSRPNAARYSSWRMNIDRPVYHNIARSSWTSAAHATTIRRNVSRNLVELVRRHHEQGAPTALDVLKEAMDQRGEITDDDRRVAAERSGLPEAAVHGVSTFYDDLLVPRGARHVRVCTGTACFAATGDAHVETVEQALGLKLGERARGPQRLARRDRLPRLLPREPRRPRRRRDRRRARARSSGCSRARRAPLPSRVFASLLDEPVLTRARRLVGLGGPGTPEELLAAVKAADVRGRGGAGFPAGNKWEFAAKATGERKVIVANGDEGDPGSYIDKLLMEDNPHLLLEGMALAGHAVGADHGFILVRSEYPRSKPALEQAIDEARAAGHLGAHFDITVIEGAGSYVVGEETALLSCLQGMRGTVSARPPFPAERGVHGYPTVVNNVETLCNIPFIARHGADAYRALSPRARRRAASSCASTSASTGPAPTRSRSG